MKKILIAEDDKFLVKIYQFKFISLGYEVIILEDGEKVLDTAKSYKPDLVLLDLVMPKKDGFEVLQELKSDPETRDINVLTISVLQMDQDIKRAKSMGSAEHLSKTKLSFTEITEVVQRYLK